MKSSKRYIIVLSNDRKSLIQNRTRMSTILSIIILLLTTSIIILNYLANKERVGYIEVIDLHGDGSYKLRVREYNKVYKKSFIYDTQIKIDSIPEYLKNTVWLSAGGTIGKLAYSNELRIGDKLEDVVYTKKIKKINYFLLVFILFVIPILYIAMDKSSTKMFRYESEIEKNINNKTQKKRVYYISIITIILVIFSVLWFSKGYYAYYITDSMIEASGKVVNFKFPENMFEDTEILTTKYWHKSRWSGALYIFLSTQIISPIYTLFTGDVVRSIFVSQGVMIAFIFVTTGFLLALYLAQIFSVKILSKYFLLFLFFSETMQVAIYSIALSNSKMNFFMGLINSGAVIPNYNGVLVIILAVLFPYWRYFITGKWDDLFYNDAIKIIYHLLIIFAAFSSPAITVFYGLISGLIFLYICIKEKSIPKIADKIASTLYASMFWATISTILGLEYITSMVGTDIISKLNGLKGSISVVFIYTLAFFLLSLLPILIMHKFRKNDTLVKKVLISLTLCYIAIISHLLLASVKNVHLLNEMFRLGYGSAFNSAYICVANIFLLLAFLITFTTLFLYLKNNFLKSFAIMFLISHFIFYIGYETATGHHLMTYGYFTMLHESNKNKPIGSNIIYLDSNTYKMYKMDWVVRDLHIKIIEDFARAFNIIDKNAVILEVRDGD